MENEGSGVKILKKTCYEWELRKFSRRKKMRVGQSIESGTYKLVGPGPGLGDYSFKVLFYPLGKNQAMYIERDVCFTIRNQSAEAVELVSGFKICVGGLRNSRSAFDDREVYRHVFTVPPQHESPPTQFRELLFTSAQDQAFPVNIKIKATIGVFIHQPLAMLHQPFDRTIFFQVATQRFYAEDSILRTQCPVLLSYHPNSQSTDDVLLSDIKPDVFRALLWFIYNNKLHKWDKEALSNTNLRDPNSFGLRMLEAADRFRLTRLKGICEIQLHGIDMQEMCFPLVCALRKSWSKLSTLHNKQKQIGR